MKIIGVEFRIISPSGRVLEVAMFPLNLPYPANFPPHWNVTTHTTEGDVTLDSRYPNGQTLPYHAHGPQMYDPSEWERAMRKFLMESR